MSSGDNFWVYSTPETGKKSVPLSGMSETTRHRLFFSVYTPLLPLYGKEEARAIAGRVCEQVGGFSRLDMAVDPRAEVAWRPGYEAVTVERMIDELAGGRPVQYVLGVTPFYGREFQVGEGVLIPRPETEELVRWIVTESRTLPPGRILDIGVGSGCIAVTLALELAGADVWGVDLSAEALAFVRKNAERLEATVHMARADVLDGEDPFWRNGLRWETIVSNPPYVPMSDRAAMHMNVRDYEPSEALFVPDQDPLLFYRAIARRGQRVLERGGSLYFEIYEGLASQTAQLLGDEGYTEVEIRRDMNDKPRMIRCKKRE